MAKCKNEVNYWVESGWSFVERKGKCGSLSTAGERLLCKTCKALKGDRKITQRRKPNVK